MSIIDPLSCGFAKVCCYNIFTKIKNRSSESIGNPKHNQSKALKERYQLFLEQFPEEIHGAVKYTSSSNTFKKIVPHSQSLGIPHLKSLRRKLPDKKNLLFDIFSSEKSSDLGERKKQHKIFDCSACLKNPSWKNALAMLPCKSRIHKNKATKTGLTESSVLKDRTKEVFNKLNQEFKCEYNTSFSTYAKDYLNTNKPADIVKMVKKNIEEQFEETCVER